MKIKLFLLVILSTFIVYLIYESAPPKEPYILSIYDKTTLPKTNYNDILKTTLAKNKPNIIYDTTLADYNYEIENLKDDLITNQNNIKQLIKKADLIILHLGKYELGDDINYNSLISKEILTDLETTYKILRKITNKNIIFIPPSGISNTLNKALNNLSYDYHITYLNSNADISTSLINALEKLQFL